MIRQIATTFTYQSYFDRTLLQNAILLQDVGKLIVRSTLQYAQSGGVAVALHPASESPVAIRFRGGDANSAEVVITPGQKVRIGSFEGFDWGLPFGWLGGGSVVLYVLDEGGDVTFPTCKAPIIFHRMRVAAVGADPAAPGTPNWPLAFPWSNANRGTIATPTPQHSAPLLRLIPEMTFIRYAGALGAAGPIDLVLKWINVTHYDQNSPPDQAAGYDNGIHYWPITFQTVPGPLMLAPLWLPPELGTFAGDQAAFYIYDPTGTYAGEPFDVVRYGRFM